MEALPSQTGQPYNADHCWQYDIRLKNLEEDLRLSGLSQEEASSLKVTDFILANEEKEKVFQEAKAFIIRHEWLGTMSLYPTHIFTARYNGILAGVVVMDMPYSFSKMLGTEKTILPTAEGDVEINGEGKNRGTKRIERLISRGACISWSPKNLASALIMHGIRWTTKNTRFRIFVSYADVEALELGTIYQSCNFFYLGRQSGTTYQFKLPNGRWVSDRYFRSRSVYKRIAKEMAYDWDPEWQERDRIIWDKVPSQIASVLRSESKAMQNSCEKRKMEPKHKYAYVLGLNKGETKWLRKLFKASNKTYDYPKERISCD